MKKATITIELFLLKELSKEAQELAIDKHINFFSSSNESTEEELQEPLTVEYATESIEANEYYFYQNGELAHTIKFVGNHPLSGSTVYQHGNQRVFI